jgi:hypothetical protein
MQNVGELTGLFLQRQRNVHACHLCGAKFGQRLRYPIRQHFALFVTQRDVVLLGK